MSNTMTQIKAKKKQILKQTDSNVRLDHGLSMYL